MSLFKKLFGGSSATKLMDWREFTEHFTRLVAEQIGAEAETEWGADLDETTVRLKLTNGFVAEMYLGNRYSQYRQNPDNLDEIIDETVQTVAQIGNQENNLAAENIIPTIKSADYVEQIRQMSQANNPQEEADLCSQHLAGDIAVVYMVDTGPSYRSLHRSELAELGIDGDGALHDLAVGNLENLLTQSEDLGYNYSDEGLYQIYLNGVLDPSLILLLDKIIALAGLDFAPYPVFAVPSRSTLLVCAAGNQAALAHMQQIIDTQWQEQTDYLISSYRYCLKNGQISLFETH